MLDGTAYERCYLIGDNSALCCILPHNKISINEKEMEITSATEHGRHIMMDKGTTGAKRRKGRDQWQCAALLRVRTNTQNEMINQR